MKPVVAAFVVFGLSMLGLTVVEKIIHKLTKNPDKSYQIGVWIFSILLGLYTYFTSLGR